MSGCGGIAPATGTRSSVSPSTTLTQLVILSSLLIGVFGFPPTSCSDVMVPGTAAGVLRRRPRVYMARASAHAANRPRRRDRHAVRHRHAVAVRHGVRRAGPRASWSPATRSCAWKIGMGVTVAMGVFKLALAVRGRLGRGAWCPRAALLGSIAGVAILLIAFLPALKVFGDPLVGLISLTVVLVTLVGRRAPAAVACRVRSRRCWPARSMFWGRAAARRGGEADVPGRAAGRACVSAAAVADARVDRRARRPGPLSGAGLAVRAGHGDRRHRQYRVGGGGRRRVPRARHSSHGGARHHGGGLLRRCGAEHAVHRASGLQGHGRARRLHASPPAWSSAAAPRCG